MCAYLSIHVYIYEALICLGKEGTTASVRGFSSQRYCLKLCKTPTLSCGHLCLLYAGVGMNSSVHKGCCHCAACQEVLISMWSRMRTKHWLSPCLKLRNSPSTQLSHLSVSTTVLKPSCETHAASAKRATKQRSNPEGGRRKKKKPEQETKTCGNNHGRRGRKSVSWKIKDLIELHI